MMTLANSYFLWALPLPFIFMLILPGRIAASTTSLWVPFYADAKHSMNGLNKRLNANSPLFWLSVIWILMVLALANPRWVGPPVMLNQESHNIIMALDISGSMDLTDMRYRGRPVSRLALVKHAALNFVDSRAGDNIGLILFGSNAYLLTPLTQDLNHVKARIDDASVGLAGNSTSLGDALGLAIKRLKNMPKKGRVVILLTDGANNSGVLEPLKAADIAKTEGIKVYTIGLGGQSTGGFSDPFFNLNSGSDLDEPTLKKIAKRTHGQYFRAGDAASLQQIYNTINALETVKSEASLIRPQIDYYPWPLAAALILLGFCLTRRGLF